MQRYLLLLQIMSKTTLESASEIVKTMAIPLCPPYESVLLRREGGSPNPGVFKAAIPTILLHWVTLSLFPYLKSCMNPAMTSFHSKHYLIPFHKLNSFHSYCDLFHVQVSMVQGA